MNVLSACWFLWVMACGAPPDPSFVFPDPAEQLLADLDGDGSGALTWDEMSASLMTADQFAAMDTDGDGLLTVLEIQEQLTA